MYYTAARSTYVHLEEMGPPGYRNARVDMKEV